MEETTRLELIRLAAMDAMALVGTVDYINYCVAFKAIHGSYLEVWNNSGVPVNFAEGESDD